MQRPRRAALLAVAALALLCLPAAGEEAAASSAPPPVKEPEEFKVKNLLKRQDLGDIGREEVVAALMEAEGNAGKAAAALRKKCQTTLPDGRVSSEGCLVGLRKMQLEEAAAEAAQSAEADALVAARKGEKKQIRCDVCQFVTTLIDARIRKELPEGNQIETGFRLLPDGTRRVETIPEVQSELYFSKMLESVCNGDICAHMVDLPRREVCAENKERFVDSCKTLVQEYDAEFSASVRDWERVADEDGKFSTPGFGELRKDLCSKEIKACKKEKKAKKKKKKQDL